MILSEAQYYEELFVHNSNWNKPYPNEEELNRWIVIEDFIKSILNELPVELSHSFNILDLGCGRGWLTNLMSDFGFVTGIDPIESVICHAKNMFPEIVFMTGTTLNVIDKFGAESFNLVVAAEVIEHIEDAFKESFLNEIHTILTENGFFILTTPRKEVQESWNKYLSPGQPVEDWMTESEVMNLLEKFNFKVLRKQNIFIHPPISGAPKIEIYQCWLFQKN